MDMNKLTKNSIEALNEGKFYSEDNGNPTIDGGHILYGLLVKIEGTINMIFNNMGVNVEKLKADLDTVIAKKTKVSGNGENYLSGEGNKILRWAFKEAEKMGDEYISVEHIFLGILKYASSDIKKLLSDNDIDRERFLKELSEIRGGKNVTSDNPEDTYKVLEKFGTELVSLARENKLDPVIGREEEIRRAIRILSRKTKNNPVLIGEPGVGKTAIVEGLAQRIVKGDVPDNLKDKKIFSLDMGSLVAGAKFRGEFEERLKNVLEEIKKSNGEILMFIDEIHTIVGAGRTDGAMDAGNILKPLLARGELHAIGATTLNEYRKYIEKDTALERRFQPVMVDEPSVEDTITMLRGLKERYEIFHKVTIADNALISAAVLSDRYISDRFLPDKAIDLVDEACALVKTQLQSMPIELDNISREIMRAEIEVEALKKDDDKLSKAKIEKLQKEIAIKKDEFNKLSAKWKGERMTIDSINELKEEIENVTHQISVEERNYNLEKVAELKYGRLPELEKMLSEAIEKQESQEKSESLLREKITDEEIANIVSKWTGIPLSKLIQGEREKLINLETILHRKIIGQDEAVTKVSDAIIRSRAGIKDPEKPIGTFIFLGPTGVGKTELAKVLSETLFDSDKNLIRIDMSEYMERHSVSKLIGAPPGYVGYEQGGQLTELVRRKPYSVILFDEIEKAHPEVFNVLLQVLDDGRITDSKGRTVDFKNTIIILTSNIGSEDLTGGMYNGRLLEASRAKVMTKLKASFKPEFLNRIDDIVLYKPLSKDDLVKILDIQLKELSQRLDNMKLKVNLTDKAKEHLVEVGYDPVYGARPLKRVIQRELENLLGKAIISGQILEGQEVYVDYDGVKLII